MTLQQFLLSPRLNRRTIINMQNEIALLNDEKTMINSFHVRDGGRGSEDHDMRLINLLDKIEERQSELNSKLEEYAVVIIQVAEFIDNLEDSNERAALNYYYVQFMNVKTIAETMFYSERTVLRILAKGINNLSARFGENMSLNVS